MSAAYKKQWVWIVALFLVINIAGLLKIISILENMPGKVRELKSGHVMSLGGRFRQFIWPIKNAENRMQSKDFVVEDVKPDMSGATCAIVIELNREIDLKKIKGYIDIIPKTEFYVDSYYSGVRLEGDFKPGVSYEVEILKGMPSADGSVLSEGDRRTIIIPDYDPTLNFKVSGIYMSLNGNQNIPIEAVNVDAIKVKAHKVYDNNIVYLLSNMNSYNIPDGLGLDVVEKKITTGCETNRPKEVLLDLRSVLSGEAHGIYFITLSKPEADEYHEDSKLVLTTDIGIVTKKSGSDLLVWLNTLSANNAIEGAAVKVYSKTNQQLMEGVTGKDGLAHFKDVDWSGDRTPFVVTASAGNDLSFIELEKSALAETDFKVQGRSYLSSGYESYLYTDRGIYRPGEKVRFRAVVRGIGQETPESFPVVLEIIRPDEKEFAKINGMLSAFGTADIEVELPDYALTGGYTANVMIPGDKQPIGSVKFSVEEFMPDRLKVSVGIEDKRFNLSEKMPISVKAEQFFGAPAAGRQIGITCDLRAVEFKPEGYKSYSFIDNTKDFSKKTIHLEEESSDDQGMAKFEFELPEGIQPPSVLSCEISAVVKEIGGQAVTAHVERTVDAYPYYIGVKQSKEGYAAVNQATAFDFVVISGDGKKIAAPELEAGVYKVVWNNVLKKDEKGEFRYVSESKEERVFEDTIKQGDTPGTFAFTPKTWGDYVIRIRGKEKNAHMAALSFYCSDSGYMPWAMERPDRLDLKLDKLSYLPGETAKLSIKSPFKGKALITISKDKIISIMTVDLANETQEIPITIDGSFAPNAYCAVTVIRAVDPDKDWVSYRAYGIIPFSLDNSTHRLGVSIGLPVTCKPKETVKIDVNVERADGSKGRSELSLALVDEGVLRLTDFKTPDPYSFFYGQRGNNVTTSDIYSLLMPEFGKKKVGADSAPGGDAGYDPKKHLNPVSAKRVKPVVLWKSSIVTDENGKATAEFKIPEFSGNLKVMAIAVDGADFGSDQTNLKVTEPLIISPTLPRVLSVNDEFILPVSIFNTGGNDEEVIVSLELSDGFQVSEKERKLSVVSNREGLVDFKLKAPSSPQKAEIRIKAKGAAYATESVTEIAVRPIAPFTVISGSGALKAPASQSIRMPADWLKGTGKQSLTVTSLPALQFAGGLKYLLQYPYGCIEQSTSSTFPLLYLKDIAGLVDPKKYNGTAIDNYVDAGIRRVLAMQTYSGGFAMWPGATETYNWGSVYATDFLTEAGKAGYAVPVLAKDSALDYCEKILSGKDEECPSDLKAYSSFVLAKAGRIKSSWIRRLEEIKDKLPGYSKFHLAASLFILGDKKAVSEMLGEGLPDKSVVRDTGDSLNSYVRENAVALSVYMDIDPENVAVPVLVKRLQGAMKNGGWETTQDNAMALLALGKYANFIKGLDMAYTGSILADKKVIAEFDNLKNVVLDGGVLSGKEIEISVQGKGNAYYYWNSEGVPVSPRVEEKDNGIKARRTLFTRDGKPLDPLKIKQGEIIVVDISIDTKACYKNIIVEDILPTGFEIENPRIATSETVEWIKKDMFEPDRIDVRDDRLLLFTDLPESGNLHYRYVARAVTKGKFALPALSVSCMYDPGIVSVSGQGEIGIGD